MLRRLLLERRSNGGEGDALQQDLALAEAHACASIIRAITFGVQVDPSHTSSLALNVAELENGRRDERVAADGVMIVQLHRDAVCQGGRGVWEVEFFIPHGVESVTAHFRLQSASCELYNEVAVARAHCTKQ